MIKAVVFDLDGVILESVDIKTDAFRELFKRHETELQDIVRIHTDNMGVSRYKKFEMIYADLLELPLEPEEMNRLDQEFSSIVFQKVVDCPFVVGAVEFLESQKDNLHLSLVSATPTKELNRIVKTRGLEPYFRSVYGSDHSKSEAVKEIISSTGYDSFEVVVVGDAVSDLEAAKNNDTYFIARRHPSNEGQLNGPNGSVHAVLEDMTGLEETLRNLERKK